MYCEEQNQCTQPSADQPSAAPSDQVSYDPHQRDSGTTAWNLITDNTLTLGSSLLEQAVPGKNIADTALTHLVEKAPRALAKDARLGGQSGVSAALAPLGVISNGLGLVDAIESSPRDAGGKLQRGLDIISNAAGLVSSTIGTGALLTSPAVAGAGAGGAGTLAALGPVGAGIGAFAGGCAAGALLDDVTNHAISGGIGKALWATDKFVTGYDEKNTEPTIDPDGNFHPNESYKKTMGWRLAQWLEK
jgi:hypothetical protein